MSSTIALITGANKGIGFETARGVAREGVHVIVAARDASRAAAAADRIVAEGGSAEPLSLDVTDAEAISAAASRIEASHGRLDILVNNAGIMIDAFDKTPSQQSLETWRATFEVNLFGQVAVTNALLPLLRRSPAARIVNVSSVLGSLADSTDPESEFYDFKIPAYNISKTALNAWTIHLAHELRGTPIVVNAAHPGFVRTELHGVDAPLTPEEGARTSIELALGRAGVPAGTLVHEGAVLAW
jgi:NAD(P)-dependent dehydrogenase (short-subunit alcohol dehydrogenase family)